MSFPCCCDKLDDIGQECVLYCHGNGIMFRRARALTGGKAAPEAKADEKTTKWEYQHLPCTLFPCCYPEKQFRAAQGLVQDLNALYFNIANDVDWLKEQVCVCVYAYTPRAFTIRVMCVCGWAHYEGLYIYMCVCVCVSMNTAHRGSSTRLLRAAPTRAAGHRGSIQSLAWR
jgi:hypothetical protein